MNSSQKDKLRNFHEAKWDEPIIFELNSPGEKGVQVPNVSPKLEEEVGEGTAPIPQNLRREKAPNLPQLSQSQVLRHYLRLSQQNLGADLNVDIGQGTCTMKYSPKINESFATSPDVVHLHPDQDEHTVQGMLEIFYKLDLILREISGLDKFSFQPGGGSQAILAIASIIRSYHEQRGETDQRDQIISTSFSHPSDQAAPAVKGYEIITIPPDEKGYPDLEALKHAVSERTAGLVVANPEDTGIFNPRIEEFTRLVHQAGGLCAYDQANANGLLGITRAKEAGFDTCFFNLHKTFSSPHGCGGPATGALGVRENLFDYLPSPVVERDGDEYYLNYELDHSIGKVRSFHGVAPVVVRAYAWIRRLGGEGLEEVAKTAVLNNNYLLHKVLKIPGASAPYQLENHRIEQVRYSWEQLTEETGITTHDVQRRMFDFGFHIWTSHHPWIVPEPFTLEPTESYSKAELDEYIAALEHIAVEARENPRKVKSAPHRSVIHRIKDDCFDDPEKWAVTWRAYLKKINSREKQGDK